MSGTTNERKMDKIVWEKLYKFSEEFVDSFTTNLVTYFYVFRQIKADGLVIKAFSISGKSLSSATNAFKNVSEILGTLVNDLHQLGSKPKLADLENWMIDVNRRSSHLKQVLLETALDVFQSYEKLFMTIPVNEIPKYADEAAMKIVKYFVSPGVTAMASAKILTAVVASSANAHRNIIQCVLGSLLTDLLRISPAEKKNSVDKFFTSAAIWYNDEVYVSEKSRPNKYGYRRLFMSELNGIPDGYERSNKFLLNYTYLLDATAKGYVLNTMEDHFRGRDAQKKWAERINIVKHRIADERQDITSSFRLDVLEDLVDVMDKIENISEKQERDADKDEEKGKLAPPTSGNKITNVKSTKIGTWHSVF